MFLEAQKQQVTCQVSGNFLKVLQIFILATNEVIISIMKDSKSHVKEREKFDVNG